MFRPYEFDVDDPAVPGALVTSRPLGLLVSHGSSGLRGTHLPFLLTGDDSGPTGPRLLMSHGSARNEHLQELTDGDPVLVAFSGPDAYVSASWYVAEPDVPTWDYVATHAHGRYRPIDADVDVRGLLDRTVRTFEERYGDPSWSSRLLDPELVDGLTRGVLAFFVEVDRWETAAKLGQDKLPDDVDVVHRRLLSGPDPAGPAVADAMTRLGVRGRNPAGAPSTTPTETPTRGS